MNDGVDLKEIFRLIDEENYFNIENKLPKEFIVKNKVLPIKEDGDVIFYLAYDYDFNLISNIEYLTKKSCKIINIEKDVVETSIRNYLKSSSYVSDSRINIFEAGESDGSSNTYIVNYLNKLIEDAINNNISDIHIEPFRDAIKIRCRIDGKLFVRDFLNIDYLPIIITRIKILSKLDIAEHRLPQDGRITFNYMGRDIDLRISTIPIIYGEKIAIRILDSVFKFDDLEMLGIDDADLKKLLIILQKLSGLILVCGPTNSGKTTTVYSILSRINSNDINITTLEDPVEYKIDGINQIQVNYKTGLEFIGTLNHILRQDFEVLSIGELRNEETVRTALRAALTGHFVLSTMHTSDSISAIYRLKDMGVENYLISNSVSLIISQRLVRKLCPHCKKEVEENIKNYTKLYHLYKPVGCKYCNNGYSGRIGVFEFLEMNENIKKLIDNNAEYEEIKKEAIKYGYIPMRNRLFDLLGSGITSFEEVMSVL